MLEVKIAGRGGQGVVLASQLIAETLYRLGLQVQSFPSFGAERRGAPVSAFVRADEEVITLRCAVRRPDWLIAFNPNLLSDPIMANGVHRSTSLIVNSRDISFEAPDTARVFLVDASNIARRLGLTAGAFPIVNAAMVGAFAKAFGLDLDTAAQTVTDLVPTKKDRNEAATREAFQRVYEVNRV